jgi:hypothetical protein
VPEGNESPEQPSNIIDEERKFHLTCSKKEAKDGNVWQIENTLMHM